jgi:deoxyribose-phosphate aldolase
MTATVGVHSDVVRDEATLRRFLHGLPGVDQVGAEARAAALATRSIKKASKQYALDLAIRCVDLTTLEGSDTEGKVRALCGKGRHPDPTDPSTPPVAAICIYPDLVAVAKSELAGSTVKVASVATAFPSGRASLAVKLADVREAVGAGADEIDMVIDVGSALEGDFDAVKADIAAVFDAIPDYVILKVILESAALLGLGGEERLVDVCRVAEDAGADFLKTSTGFHPSGGASVRAVELMAHSVGDRLGVKASGGIRTAEDAVAMLDAGATRLGLSGTRAVLDGLD